MFIASVVGNVWGTRKHPSMERRRLLLVQPIDPLTEKPLGDAVMAIDGGVDSGPGSVVLVVDEGNGARQILGDRNAPVRAVVCGIVEKVVSGRKAKSYE